MRSAALLVFFCSAAVAQNAPSPSPRQSAAAGGTALVVEDAAAGRRLFQQLDRNGDDYLSVDELRGTAGNDQNWLAVDRDGDGRISREEFIVVRKPSANP